MNNFWNNYYKKPIEEIPWQKVQADWFKELVDNGEFKGESILDLGCGTGGKSIYLLKNNGCNSVMGVDISERAIKYAVENAEKAGVLEQCTFVNANLADGSFLKDDQMFDCLLDWATIHTIPQEKLENYAHQIDKHCKKNGLYLVRAFSSDTHEEYFVEKVDDQESKIYLFSEEQLSQLFPNFKILKRNVSKPKTKQNYFFIEFLMQKI